ncbi:hypothetical protein [uncultured Desulfovibrio sp.]|uniref:hypothetical protein n=1 Tax=uncultured Desulfovibrio sp. TaxID=167968 RepID=UPI00261F387C|nr:hypothetical protein [uncultured Desulfovibrio sp.]
MRHLSFIIMILLILCGCTKRLTDFGPPEFGTIERGETVYIVPDSGILHGDDRREGYGMPVDSTRYPDIEVQLAKMFQKSFTPFTRQAIIGDRHEPWYKDNELAKANNARYIVYLYLYTAQTSRLNEKDPQRYMIVTIKVMDLKISSLPRSISVRFELGVINPQDVTTMLWKDFQPAFRKIAKLLFEGEPCSRITL